MSDVYEIVKNLPLSTLGELLKGATTRELDMFHDELLDYMEEHPNPDWVDWRAAFYEFVRVRDNDHHYEDIDDAELFETEVDALHTCAVRGEVSWTGH